MDVFLIKREDFWGGQGPRWITNEIDYITIASEGNAIDFGNLTSKYYKLVDHCIKFIHKWSYGQGPYRTISNAVDVIDYVEIETIGNALDFGDCSTTNRDQGGVFKSNS